MNSALLLAFMFGSLAALFLIALWPRWLDRLVDNVICIVVIAWLRLLARYYDWHTDRQMRGRMRGPAHTGPLPRHSVMGEIWIDAHTHEDLKQ